MEGREIPTEVGKIDVPIPPEDLVYDYMFEVHRSSTSLGRSLANTLPLAIFQPPKSFDQ